VSEVSETEAGRGCFCVLQYCSTAEVTDRSGEVEGLREFGRVWDSLGGASVLLCFCASVICRKTDRGGESERVRGGCFCDL
jgi:hypothetical protein